LTSLKEASSDSSDVDRNEPLIDAVPFAIERLLNVVSSFCREARVLAREGLELLLRDLRLVGGRQARVGGVEVPALTSASWAFTASTGACMAPAAL
jgi:hypothetical protein